MPAVLEHNLEGANFPRLQYLTLISIGDLSVLEKVILPCLQELRLNFNKISDISVFQRVNFPCLQILWLQNNRISDVSGLVEAINANKFLELKILNLRNNPLSEI